jgi:hypothetical protein
MVLCTLTINTIARQNYFVGLSGRKRVKICNMGYLETGAAGGTGTHKLIQIKSDILRVPYGNNNSIVFTNQRTHEISNVSYEMCLICDMNGYIDIQLIDLLGNNLATFVGFYMILDITDDDEVALPELYVNHPELHKHKNKK